ncbi:mechanosensitive ion channel domain-containing protein [Acidithiobacillus sp.]|uniref:mechanosensitive ion channel family protein n=1 Tax=Acidithiobacillus sp. TaxID=1872118 RepID=UPI0025C5982B|nr:mechanosensitive ion channel domain-containing protein [Acidithiobacillus sp.]
MSAWALRIAIGFAWIVLLFGVGASGVHAESAQFATDSLVLKHIHEALTHSTDPRQLRPWRAQVQDIIRQANACIQEETADLDNIDKGLKVVGPFVSGEPQSLTQLRDNLLQQQRRASGRQAACKVLYVGGNDILNSIHKKELALRTRYLFQRGADIFGQWQGLQALPVQVWTQERDFWLYREGEPVLQQSRFQGALGFALATYILAALLRQRSRRSWRHLYPLLAPIGLGLLAWSLGVFYPLIVLLVGVWTTFIVLTWTFKTLLRHLQGLPARAQREAVLLRVLWRPLRFVLTLASFIGLYELLDRQASRAVLDNVALLTVFHVLVAIALLWLLWRARRFTFFRRHVLSQLLLVSSILATVALDLLGYVNLADFLFFGISVTVVSLLLALILTWVVEDLSENEESDTGVIGDFLRRRLGFSPTEIIPWVTWIKALLFVAIWLGALIAALFGWGLSHSGLALVWHYFVQGYTIGGMHVEPFRWLIALALLILLFNINNWLQRQLSNRSRLFRHMDVGSRHSVLAIIRYLGFLLAFLIALSTAGVALHNLAIIAGALSVGIGFGLQNIVNNFVSGLILLLERPIRVGDWVKVGNTEGTVQRLSIRYTLILTFDRTEVFVPNSELISGQVTNWMYSNAVLRLMIPLQIDHDANIDKVREILEEVGRKHPEVLQEDDPRGLPPTALLLDVSPSALVFYLRVYISDCNRSFLTQTELRAMAVEALHRHGIRLAHPQQDVHLIAERAEAGAQRPYTTAPPS